MATVGPMPLTMRVTPEGEHRSCCRSAAIAKQGLQVVNPATGAIVQELPQASAFVGLAFSPDGRTLYSSGGNQDVVYRYDWRGGRATLRDSIVLGVQTSPRASGRRYPAGLAPSPDGRMLYVAENLADSLAVVDVADRNGRAAIGHGAISVRRRRRCARARCTSRRGAGNTVSTLRAGR